MDRFVWFILLVVISHVVTEFTRVTGYTRGPRQDVVTVNDSSIQPIKVLSLVQYPGQEYGLYEQQNQQYYNGSNHYSNYANSNNNNSNNYNLLSSLFNQFTRNNRNGQQQPATSDNVSSNNLLNMPINDQGDAKFFSFRSLIDSIFEIPISTLRAVNNLVASLTGVYIKPQKQQQQQEPQPQEFLQPQQPIKYFSYFPYQSPYLYYYGMLKSVNTIQPKSQFEMLDGKNSATEATTTPTITVTIPARKSSPIKNLQR